MANPSLSHLKIFFKGAGEMASGIACRLHGANLHQIAMAEVNHPLAVRRAVSFCEAVHDGSVTVEGIDAARVTDRAGIESAWQQDRIAVIVDPDWKTLHGGEFDVVIDATIAKRNLGTTRDEAPLVIGLGPGFTAGKDVHLVIETNRGHNLGRLITTGTADANTGIPGSIGGYTAERVLRAPCGGIFSTERIIGDRIKAGEPAGEVAGETVVSVIDGVIRGLIRPGASVTKGLKIGDIDPRGDKKYCFTVSDKARALGGSVLEAIMAAFNH